LNGNPREERMLEHRRPAYDPLSLNVERRLGEYHAIFNIDLPAKSEVRVQACDLQAALDRARAYFVENYDALRWRVGPGRTVPSIGILTKFPAYRMRVLPGGFQSSNVRLMEPAKTVAAKEVMKRLLPARRPVVLPDGSRHPLVFEGFFGIRIPATYALPIMAANTTDAFTKAVEILKVSGAGFLWNLHLDEAHSPIVRFVDPTGTTLAHVDLPLLDIARRIDCQTTQSVLQRFASNAIAPRAPRSFLPPTSRPVGEPWTPEEAEIVAAARRSLRERP
jgi:hypothetical protein